MEETFYKIRRRSDGLFSTGGHYPGFSKKGKIWRTLGHLRNHLSSLASLSRRESYTDCEIVELRSVELILCSVSTELENIKRREQERHQAALERQQQERERQRIEKEEDEKRKLRELLQKYPDFNRRNG